MTPRQARIATPDLAPHGGPRGGAGDTHIRLDLSTNVNPYGPPASVLDAARNADLSAYPDPTSHEARARAARAWKRPIAEVAFGAGVSELLPALFSAQLKHDDAVVLATPLYGEYARAAQLVGARTIGVTRRSHVPRTSRLLAALRRFAPKLVVVAAPGNPLGEAWSRDDLMTLATAAQEYRCVLVIDQSYDAFLDRPLGDPALPGHGAVVHLRSLTKDFAIAGLRAAYAIAPEAMIRELEARRAPWSASAPAQAAAIATFADHAQDHVAQSTRALRVDVAAFVEALQAEGVGARITDVHWALCNVSVAQAARLERDAGIRVRTLDDHFLTGLARIVAPPIAQLHDVVTAIVAAVKPSHRTTESA